MREHDCSLRGTFSTPFLHLAHLNNMVVNVAIQRRECLLVLKHISLFPLLSCGFSVYPQQVGPHVLYHFLIYLVDTLTFLTPLPSCVLFPNSWPYLWGSIFLCFSTSVCLRDLLYERVCWYTCTCVETAF